MLHAMQGVQLAGRPEEGQGMEGAPQDLLDRVTAYLIQERGKLRADAASSAAGRPHYRHLPVQCCRGPALADLKRPMTSRAERPMRAHQS